MENNYKKLEISFVENLDEYNQHHQRYKKRESAAIIHNGMWHFSRCETMEHLNSFCELLNITYSFNSENDYIKFYKTNTVLNDMSFWELNEIPKHAKKIKGLSNGIIVDCYFTKENDLLTIYRPNPNAKKVYKKMDFKKELDFRKNNVYF